MHLSVHAFVADVVARYQMAGRVLEVGAYDVNGTVRDVFGPDYLGVDTRPGPCVDEVVDGTLLWYLDHGGMFDVAVSTETLEHDPRPWRTVRGMGEALVDGGYCVLTARGFGYERHDYPGDYWRFTESGMSVLLHDAGLTVLEVGPDTDVTAPGVFAVARKQ